MQSRVYVFMAGIEQAAQPDAGTPSDASDIVPYGWLTTNFALRRLVTNSYASPYSAQAGTSIAHGMTSVYDSCLLFLKSNSGAVDMSANPQIAAGTRNGQELELQFTSDTDTVLLEDGNGLSMPNGNVRSLAGTVLRFNWDNAASLWRCTYWNNVGSLV